MSKIANHVQPHRHIISDVPVISPYMVAPSDPNGLGVFTSIQAAIDQAVADGHEDADDPAVVIVSAGRYTENVSLRRGVYLQGLPNIFGGVTVVGSVTCSLTDGGGPIEKNVTGMAGVSIETTPGNIGLHFTGAVAQQLLVSQMFIDGKVGGQPIVVDNTGINVTRSACIVGTLKIYGEVGVTSPLVLVSAGQLLIDDFVDQLVDQSMVCLQTDGIGNVAVSTGLLQGGVRLEGVSPDPDVIGQAIITTTPPREALFLAPGNGRILANLQLIGGVSPNVVGTGVLVSAGNVSFTFGGTGFDPLLTIVHPVSIEPDTYYTPSLPGAAAAWGGLGVPTTQEEALDRMAVQLAVLGGPIP